MLHFRRIAVAPLVFGLGMSAAIAAASDANGSAYDVALKCAVANGVAEQDEHDAGHPQRVVEFEQKSHRSFDLAVSLGGKIGLSNEQIQRDLDAAKDNELPRMMRDQSYYLGIVSTCKAVGLM